MNILTADASDAAEIYRIMTEARSLMPDPGWYCTDSEKYIRAHIENPDTGIAFKAVDHGCLAAFFILHYPGNTPDSLGHYMKLGREDLGRVVHMDSLAVRPDFRGRGLQSLLMAHGEQYLNATPYCHLMGTVHPENRYSLNNFLKLGYRIVATTEKYGGLPRHVLYKSLSQPPAFAGSGNNPAPVSIY